LIENLRICIENNDQDAGKFSQQLSKGVDRDRFNSVKPEEQKDEYEEYSSEDSGEEMPAPQQEMIDADQFGTAALDELLGGG